MDVKALLHTVKDLLSILLVLTLLLGIKLCGRFVGYSTGLVSVLMSIIFMLILTETSLPLFGFIMTDCVTMFYYAQHTRPITDGKRVCERCHGAAAPLPAGRAVTELRARQARDWRKHTACRVLFPCVVRSNIERKVQYNKLKRSISYYTTRALKALAKASATASAPQARRGFSKGDTLSCLYPPLT